jgi:hypothetical protein
MHVYIVKSGGSYKIGYSTNYQKRLETIQTSCSDPCVLILTIPTPDGPYTEKQLHDKYADKRQSGEWFKLSHEDIVDIIDMYHCDVHNFRERTITSKAFLLFDSIPLKLYHYMFREDPIFYVNKVSRKILAEKLNVSEPTINRALKELLDKELTMSTTRGVYHIGSY